MLFYSSPPPLHILSKLVLTPIRLPRLVQTREVPQTPVSPVHFLLEVLPQRLEPPEPIAPANPVIELFFDIVSCVPYSQVLLISQSHANPLFFKSFSRRAYSANFIGGSCIAYRHRSRSSSRLICVGLRCDPLLIRTSNRGMLRPYL